MKFNTRQILLTAVAAALVTPAAFAGQGINRHQSERVVRNARNTTATETDYESRMSPVPCSALQRIAGKLGKDNLSVASFGTSSAADTAPGSDPLILYWNFNDSGVAAGQAASALALQSDVTAVPPPTQTSTIDLTNFSSGVTMSSTATTVNLAPGDVSGAGQSLSFSAASGNNGKSFDFTFSGTGLQDLILTQAVRSTDTGFGGITLSYSTNGTTFTTFATDSITRSTAGGFNTLSWDLSTINSLDNAASITFRETFNTVTGSTGGNTQIDNIQLNATTLTPVPEPSTWIGAGLAVVAIGWMQRRRLLALVGIPKGLEKISSVS